MLCADARETATDIGDLLMELYSRRAAACGQEDWHRLRRLELQVQHVAGWRPAFVGRPELPR